MCVTFQERMMLEWKTLEIKGKLVSAKQKVFKAFRLIRGLGNVSSPAPISYETVNPPTRTHPHTISYTWEAELKKAEALTHWRRRDEPK